ncbi:MAG: hypothetical protein PHC61_15105, partial [Chitinivibrionales bacterium]|nr:hypothetical protein [Chitinivibrionales bacterium]
QTRGCIVAGFRINIALKKNDFPADIADSATSLLLETGTTVDIPEICRDILVFFSRFLKESDEAMHARYVHDLCGIGAAVEINGEQGTLTTVEPDGRLCLVSGGRKKYFTSGPVRFMQ